MDRKDEGREWMIVVVCEKRETILKKKNQEILIFK